MASARPVAVTVVRTFGRTAIIIAAALGVAALIFVWLGAPNLAREYRQDEIARFAPAAAHGIGQFLGESFLMGLIAYVSRRWLRVRL